MLLLITASYLKSFNCNNKLSSFSADWLISVTRVLRLRTSDNMWRGTATGIGQACWEVYGHLRGHSREPVVLAGGWARSEGQVLVPGWRLGQSRGPGAGWAWPPTHSCCGNVASDGKLHVIGSLSFTAAFSAAQQKWGGSRAPALLEVAWEGSCSGNGSQASAQTGEKVPSHPTPCWCSEKRMGLSHSLGKRVAAPHFLVPLSVLVSLGCHYKTPQAGWLQLQTCISCGSGGWKVQDQGLQGSVSGENYFRAADGCLLRVLPWLRENSFLPFLQDHVPVGLGPHSYDLIYP